MAENAFLTGDFRHACEDYRYLLNRNYPPKKTLKLVGDQYRLSGLQRTVLMRGIDAVDTAEKRRRKIITSIENRSAGNTVSNGITYLYIDGYNVFFTVMNYLMGKVVFIADDGMMRDVGGTYGTIENENYFYRAVDLVFDYLREVGDYRVIVYLDAPVVGSAGHLTQIEKRLKQNRLPGDVQSVKYVDRELKEIKEGVLAGSDSEIIDFTNCPVLDLAAVVLTWAYQIDPPRL